MSGATTDTRMDRPRAVEVAKAFVDLIESCTDQLIVAGSLRRKLGRIGDVEIVAVPKVAPVDTTSTDLFGESVQTRGVDLLDLRMQELLAHGLVQKRPKSDGTTFWGPRGKYLTFDGARVDLFSAVNGHDAKTPPVAEPERFGWILLLRTGPYKFSKQMVVPKGKRTDDGRPGLIPAYIRAVGDKPEQKGWLCYRTSGERIETPSERSVFELFGLDYVEPWSRV